jgi:hypothetical protein
VLPHALEEKRVRIQYVALWYLMVPPPPAGTQGVVTGVPQSQWSGAETFRTWADCDSARHKEVDHAVHSSDDQAILFAENAKCENTPPETPAPQAPPHPAH